MTRTICSKMNEKGGLRIARYGNGWYGLESGYRDLRGRMRWQMMCFETTNLEALKRQYEETKLRK